MPLPCFFNRQVHTVLDPANLIPLVCFKGAEMGFPAERNGTYGYNLLGLAQLSGGFIPTTIGCVPAELEDDFRTGADARYGIILYNTLIR